MSQTNKQFKVRDVEKKIFVILWVTYASFYLCRVNISVALPAIIKDLGYSRTNAGMLGGVFFVIYAIGQLLNGYIADVWGARRLIIVGILCSAILNIFFGFTTGLVIMIIIWGLNGYFQSMGWAPSVKIFSNWFFKRKRGITSGLFGTCYQIGNVFSWFVAGILLSFFHWRVTFWAPAFLFLIVGVLFFIWGKESPGKGEINPVNTNFNKKSNFYPLKKILYDAKIWRFGITSLCLSIIAYGIIYWIPTYISETQGVNISNAAFKSLIIPLFGSFGTITAGWISDKLFNSRKVPVIIIMFLLLGFSLFLVPVIQAQNLLCGTIICLAFMGFMLYGPHVLLSTTIAVDYGDKGMAASVAGFMNFLNYVGAAITSVLTGYIVDKLGWSYVFYFWTGIIFLGILVIAPLWKKA